MAECSLRFAVGSSSLFKDVQCQTYQKFKAKIQGYIRDRGLTVHKTGAIPSEYFSLKKRPLYKEYIETTSQFFPRFDK